MTSLSRATRPPARPASSRRARKCVDQCEGRAVTRSTNETLSFDRWSESGTARPPTTWPEPAWRLRLRELTTRRDDCVALRTALADSAWPVRLRAMDLVSAPCATDSVLTSTLRRWIDALPVDASRRTAGGVSWHAAAHAL